VIKETAATVATPARDLLLHSALGQKHILVQVEMPVEETFTLVRSSMSEPVKGQVKRRKSAKSGLVGFSDIMQPGGSERCTQETAEMAVMPSLGTPTLMAMVRLRILALVAMHAVGLWTADGTTRLGSGVYNPSMNPEATADQTLPDGGDQKYSGAAAYTGAGGNASGGSVEGGDDLISLFSGTHRIPGPSMTPDKCVREWWRRWRCQLRLCVCLRQGCEGLLRTWGRCIGRISQR